MAFTASDDKTQKMVLKEFNSRYKKFGEAWGSQWWRRRMGLLYSSVQKDDNFWYYARYTFGIFMSFLEYGNNLLNGRLKTKVAGDMNPAVWIYPGRLGGFDNCFQPTDQHWPLTMVCVDFLRSSACTKFGKVRTLVFCCIVALLIQGWFD